MLKVAESAATRTTTDVVFDQLFAEISTLRLLPGTRISEADIAARLGVSRQPVRDAFNRLGNMGLLAIRPQRATRVRGFSMPVIQNARFIRLSVELEVVTRACAVWTKDCAHKLNLMIDAQQSAIESGETNTFHQLDYDFHKSICELGGNPLAFDTIESCKQPLDRLCVLSLRRPYAVTAVVEDHVDIANALAAQSVADARGAVERHLSRLDATIAEIHEAHANYFE